MIPAKASVFSHGKRIAPWRMSHLCPWQNKKSVNPLVSRVCGLFHINFREHSKCTKQHKTTYKNKKKVVKRLSEIFSGKKRGLFCLRAIPLAISGVLWYAINVPSIDKGRHGFSGLKPHLASFSSLAGISPPASSASSGTISAPEKLPRTFRRVKIGAGEEEEDGVPTARRGR